MPYGMGESKKKDAVWRQKEARIILFKFNAVAERRQWSSAASIPRRKSLAKLFPQLAQVKNAGFHQLAVGGKGRVVIAPAIVQMFLRSRSAVCAALFGTAGFPIHQYPPGSLSKNNCAQYVWFGISQCTPSSPGRYRNPPFSNSKPTAALRTTE